MSNILDIEKCVKSLSKKRPIFHSEADFQFALAWEIQKEYPKANIRLEYPVGKMNIDIVVFFEDKSIPIELKYKTDKLYKDDNKKYNIENEDFLLKDHAAQNIGRHNFLKDIERIENISEFLEGYTIWLTNSEKYWNSPKSIEKTTSKNFTVHHNANIKCNSTLEWNEHTDIKTINEYKKITLKNNYTVSWEDYSAIKTEKNNTFKYCITTIKKTS